jgi:hypothetical protein
MFPAMPKNRVPPVDVGGIVLPLFSTAAASGKIPLTAGLDLASNIVDTQLGTAPSAFVFGNNLFVGSPANASNSVPTSQDGTTWTLRTMPASEPWRVGTDGTNFVAVDAGGTASATSADGITWSSGGALSVSANADADNIPVENGGNWIVFNTSSTITHSVDGGANWTTQTLPAINGIAHFLVIGGLFWYWASGTTAYTSPTGLTGSWTSRTMPLTPNAGLVWQNPGSADIHAGTTANATTYKTADGINWTDTTVTALINTIPAFNINGVYFSLDLATNHSYVKHGNYNNRHWSSKNGFTGARLARNTRGAVIVPVSGGPILIDQSKLFGVFRDE